MVSMEKNERRVVITGMGVVTSVGTGIGQFWDSIISGKSGVSRIEIFDVEKIASKIAAQIKDFDPTTFMNAKSAKRMDRFAQFAVAATILALEDSGLKITGENENDVGVYIGRGIGGMATLA